MNFDDQSLDKKVPSVGDRNEELRLARLQIKKLELQLEAKQKMEEYNESIRKLEFEIKSNTPSELDRLEVRDTLKEGTRLADVQNYVDNLPTTSMTQAHAVSPGTCVKLPMHIGRPLNVKTPNVMDTFGGLPKKDLVKFNGDPKRYYGFLREFNSSVVRYTSDPDNLLSYLVSCCEGEAKEAIERCCVLEPKEGYNEAMRILQRRFGQPHVIARGYINELTNGPPISPRDQESLIKLSERMKLCVSVLARLSYEADLNSCHTLSMVVQRLPNHMQNKWAEAAAKILKEGREPIFLELAEFISDQADALNAMLMYQTASKTVGNPSTRSRPEPSESSRRSFAHTMATSASREVQPRSDFSKPLRCLKCNDSHYLDQCPAFKFLSASERAEFTKANNLCFLCLKANHRSTECRVRRSCGLDGCNGKHHPLLHRSAESHVMTSLHDPNVQEGYINTTLNHQHPGPVSLGVIPVKVCGPSATVLTYAFLDSGSDSSLVEEGLLHRLGIKGLPGKFKLTTINSSSFINFTLVEVYIQSLESLEVVRLDRAWSVKSLSRLNRFVPSTAQLKRWKHLEDVNFPVIDNASVTILIGCDAPKAHWVLDQRVGGPKEPYAVQSPLGRMLMGPCATIRDEGRVNTITTSANEEISARLENMFRYEFSEVSCVKRDLSVEDKAALNMMKTSMKLENGHYQIALPWKTSHPDLPLNKSVAYRRLMQLKGKLLKNADLRRMYCETMNDYLTNGYAEICPQGEAAIEWYIPHHPVFHPLKPGKVRVVYDCAATYQNTSLNQQLLSGPDLVNNLCGVLTRFRQHLFAAAGDIEAMFHQVKLPAADRDCLRFLWWPAGSWFLEPVSYRMTSHPFGAKSSPSCASLALRQTITDNEHRCGGKVAKLAYESFYVDDLLISLPSVVQLEDTVARIKNVLRYGGFNLRKLQYNVTSLPNSSVSANEPVANIALNGQSEDTRRTLGVEWNTVNDCFRFMIKDVPATPNRRSILSFVASLFDPLGLVAPVLFPARRLLQDLCRSQKGWEEDLDEKELETWQKRTADFQALPDVYVSRCIVPKSFGKLKSTQLHGFSDASERGYGAAIYIRLTNETNKVHCTLLLGKSRVSPIRSVSIPRLELTAAVLSSKLMAFVKEELSLQADSVTFWTDSMVVLRMIQNTTTRYQTFVANRLATIHELTSPAQWMYVEGKKNPADLASRGISLRKKQALHQWLAGPTFLWSVTGLPGEPSSISDVYDPADEELRVFAISTVKRNESMLSKFASCSSWFKMMKIFSWLHRYKLYLRGRLCRGTPFPKTGPLTSAELNQAAEDIVRLVQSECFPEEMASLKDRGEGYDFRHLKRACSPMRKLCPVMENGTLRVGGRLQWASLDYNAKHPVILPKNHFVTTLSIRHHHELNGHVGSSQPLYH